MTDTKTKTRKSSAALLVPGITDISYFLVSNHSVFALIPLFTPLHDSIHFLLISPYAAVCPSH